MPTGDGASIEQKKTGSGMYALTSKPSSDLKFFLADSIADALDVTKSPDMVS